jgi:hypothetical protein
VIVRASSIVTLIVTPSDSLPKSWSLSSSGGAVCPFEE